MTNQRIDSSPGHAFISYVREDADRVNRLQSILEAAGIKVWRDTGDLWPGQDWKIEIRKAITAGSIAFIACFSDNSQRKQISYQNEELTLAADQIRLRPPGVPWLIPVRFSECELPYFDLGAGRTLDSLQRVDLFGDTWEIGAARLTAAVVKILGIQPVIDGYLPPPQPSMADRLKLALLSPDKQIEAEEIVTRASRSVRTELQNKDKFPNMSDRITGPAEGIWFLVGQADAYATAVKPITELLVPGCTWGEAKHEVIWTRVMREIANADKRRAGNTALINMTRLPALIAMYAAGLAAIHRNNFGALRAVTIDPAYREDNRTTVLIDAVHPWLVFGNNEITANVLAMQSDSPKMDDSRIEQLLAGKIGKRHTPVSDYLHGELRDAFSDLIIDDEEYTETFDRLELFLGLIAADAKQSTPNQYMHGPWYGRFTWRTRWRSIEEQLRDEYPADASSWSTWPPFRAGLFGGSTDRVSAAAEIFISTASRAREHQW